MVDRKLKIRYKVDIRNNCLGNGHVGQTSVNGQSGLDTSSSSTRTDFLGLLQLDQSCPGIMCS